MSEKAKLPRISIVVPTLNRPVKLIAALQAIAEYKPKLCEVVVVDQSDSTEKTRQYITSNFSFVKYIIQKRKNLPLARNTGIKNSSADIVLFLDDDCIIDKNCINQHIAAHHFSTYHIFAGRIRQNSSSPWSDSNTVSHIDSKTAETTGNFDLDYDGRVEYASGGHFSVKRSVFSQTGMFNALFSGNALFEDVDFSLRARKCGFVISYNPNALVFHNSDSSGGCYESKGTKYLLERLHNHLLFYLLHFRLFPGKELRRYLLNLIEYLSRKENARHNKRLLLLSLVTGIKAYLSALHSFIMFKQYRKKPEAFFFE